MKQVKQRSQQWGKKQLACAVVAVLGISAGTAAADITSTVTRSPPAEGSQNIMVMFDETAEEVMVMPGTPYWYRGVTYSVLSDDAMSLVFGASSYGDTMPTGIPVVRHMAAPLLATVCDIRNSTNNCMSMEVALEFDTPTPVFGFGYGFNDINQPQNDKTAHKIGSVTLYNEDGHVIKHAKLNGSRLYCCTEGRFDYAAKGKRGDKHHYHSHRHNPQWGEVAKAVIKFSHDYTPFLPGVSPPMEGPMKFFGIDNVSYTLP
jgi:hypothetical protein